MQAAVGAGVGADKQALRDALKTCQLVLQGLGQRVAENVEGAAPQAVEAWTETALEAYAGIVGAKLKLEWMDPALTAAVTKATENVGDNFEKLCETVMLELETQRGLAAVALDPAGTEEVKAFKRTLRPDEVDEDADLEVMGEVNREMRFVCPLTRAPMLVPMKCACKHHISKEGAELLLRKGQAKCPIPGCSAMWTRGGTVVDEDLQMEVTRFFKNKRLREAVAEGSSSSSQHTIAIE